MPSEQGKGLACIMPGFGTSGGKVVRFMAGKKKDKKKGKKGKKK